MVPLVGKLVLQLALKLVRGHLTMMRMVSSSSGDDGGVIEAPKLPELEVGGGVGVGVEPGAAVVGGGRGHEGVVGCEGRRGLC